MVLSGSGLFRWIKAICPEKLERKQKRTCIWLTQVLTRLTAEERTRTSTP